MRPPVRHFIGLALAAAVLTACGTTSDHGLNMAMRALQTPTPVIPPQASPRVPPCNPTASLRPSATLPAPGKMPPGSFMAEIQQKGFLVAGVNTGAYKFGYLDPATGNIDGFEIDLVRELAHAIFGDWNPKRVHLVALRVTQREHAVADGQVDIVADTVTVTCKRKLKVDFSTVYYQANQRVCATAKSTPIDVMKNNYPEVRPYGTSQAIDCLVLLQEGKIPAISTDDAILLGFKVQDHNTKIIGGSLAPAPYGMEISKANPEFVRFVNGVLAKLRADGTWRALYDKWLGGIPYANPVLPPPQYYG